MYLAAKHRHAAGVEERHMLRQGWHGWTRLSRDPSKSAGSVAVAGHNETLAASLAWGL